jgi:aldose sugar dehydrogenase
LKLYYAYGIRNSFGLAFDPVTGKLWATENGQEDDDEINLVEPGFNSGWVQVHGLARLTPEFDPSELVDFDKKGNYRDPELVWQNTAGPTAVLFMTSDKMGSQYVNDMFVADVHHGSIYHFKLNADRTHLALPPQLDDKVISNSTADVLDEIIFGENFGGITDLKIGPDGYLYVVSVGLGKIFRIAPR